MNFDIHCKSIITKLTSLHTQIVWGSKGEIVRVMVLVVYCNYLKKQKIQESLEKIFLK